MRLCKPEFIQRITDHILLCLMLVLCSSVALAAGIQVNNLNEAKLYALYSEVQSQLLLNKLGNADSYKQVTNYDDIERNPDKHTGEKMYFKGTVLQVIEGSTTTYRISMDKYGNDVFLVTDSSFKRLLFRAILY